MGAAASIAASQPEDVQFQIYKEMKKTYDNDCKPNISSGKWDERQGFREFKEKFDNYCETVSGNNSRKECSNLHKLNEMESHEVIVGDVVKVQDGHLYFEGVVTDISGSHATVDFGDTAEVFPISACSIVIKSAEYEVGDRVEVCPIGTHLYFVGHIISINDDCTYDIILENEDEEDIEHGATIDRMRKLMTNRLVHPLEHFRAAVRSVQAVKAFSHILQLRNSITVAKI